MTSPETRSASRPKVVIIGAGFAGINAAHDLRNADVDIVLVDRNNFHTFQPLLYQVSTASLPSDQVASPARSIFRHQENFRFRLGEVVGADWDAKELLLDDDKRLSWDYLIIGGGATANFFGIPGMDEHAWPLYTMDDAIRLRQHLLTELEDAVLDHDRPIHESTVVVVGGGPTGVEMAGALASMAKDLLGRDAQDLHVVLVEAGPRLLAPFNEKSSERAASDLRERGVDVRLNTMVASADADGVALKDGSRIDSRTIVWGAGVRANDLGKVLGVETGRGDRIVVEGDLQLPGRPGVFAAGDIALTISDGNKDNVVPQLAPAAIQGGKHIAAQIKRLVAGKPTSNFHYRDKGIMAVIGRGDAVVELPKPVKFRFGGRLAWVMWLGVHIVYLVGFRNRIKVLVDWGWNYVTSRGSSAILLREVPSDTDAASTRESGQKAS